MLSTNYSTETRPAKRLFAALNRRKDKEFLPIARFQTMPRKPGPKENSNLRWITISAIVILAFLAGWFARPKFDKHVLPISTDQR
jgi:hypothetical protein